MKRSKCIQEYRWATNLGFVGALADLLFGEVRFNILPRD